jgi:uncharacterized membrane protein YtjA (UPF0391 family)
MFYWAIACFIFAIIAAVIGFSGLAQESAHIGKALAAVGLVLALVSFFFHRRSLRD